MAKTDTLHIRVEPSVKMKAEETLNDLGLSITEAVNVFLNQVILHDGITFKIENNELILTVSRTGTLSDLF